MAESSHVCHWKKLSRDLMVDVLSRLDGLSLAAAAGTCTELQDVARKRGLWEKLCKDIWPSTASPEAKDVVPFDRFYVHSHPLVLFDGMLRKGGGRGGFELRTEASGEEFMSLVDVYYKGVCVLSKVIDGIPEAGYGGDQKWFTDCPFELDVVELDHGAWMKVEDDEDVSEGEEGEDLSSELEEDVKISWILLNKKQRRSVNVSSWKPLIVQKSWICGNSYTLQFGCAVPVDGRVLPHGVAECMITARCELTKVEDGRSCGLKWEEIRMNVKDMTGAHLGRKKTLEVLNQALYCSRSENKAEIGKGYRNFKKIQKKKKLTSGSQQTLVNGFCLFSEILFFAAFYCAFLL